MGYIGAGPTRFNTADELTVTGDAEFNGNLTVKGTTVTIDSATVQTVDLGDNDKIRLGDGDDLQIYHDGSHSYIKDAGTGQLRILATDLRINNTANDKSYITGTDGAEISLYHNGSGKLATTSTGVAVTGTVTADGLAVIAASGDTPVSVQTATGGSFIQISDTNTTAGRSPLVGTITDDLVFYTNNGSYAERLRIDSSGNVGIGTASPTSKLSVVSGTNSGITVNDGTVNTILFNTSSANGSVGTTTNHPMAFYANNAERMRISNTGRWWVGQAIGTTLGGNGSEAVTGIMSASSSVSSYTVIQANGSNAPLYVASGPNRVGNTLIHFGRNGSNVGSISSAGTTTSYNTTSDYRLKENVTADWDATTRLKQLNPVRFNFIADADTTVDGFLAHEVQDIVPEAINGTKDAMRDEEYVVSAATGYIYTPAVEATYDEDGVELTAAVDEVIHSTDVERPEELAEGQQWRETTAAVMGTRSVPDYQGIDQSKLVPLLVKTIQELEARIAALETA